MDVCHEDAVQVARVQFKKFQAQYEHVIKSLRSGASINNFRARQMPVFSQQINYNNGLYNKHDADLKACVAFHTERWIYESNSVQSITRTFLGELSKRCLSVTEIVLVTMLYKARYFIGDIPFALGSRSSALKVPHYNQDIKWRYLYDTMIDAVQNPSTVSCPEMKNVFEKTLTTVIEAIEKSPSLLEKSVPIVERLFDMKWDDCKLTHSQKENVCFGGLDPQEFTHSASKIKTMACYRNFENGDFTEISSWLLSVQLTLRVWLLLSSYQDEFTILPRDVKERFSGITLVDIRNAVSTNHLFNLFQYPLSLKGGEPPFMQCEVKIEDRTYYPVLEVAVVYALFGHLHDERICTALKKVLVNDKLEHFNKPTTDTIKYKDMPLPKKWLRYRVFKELIQKESKSA